MLAYEVGKKELAMSSVSCTPAVKYGTGEPFVVKGHKARAAKSAHRHNLTKPCTENNDAKRKLNEVQKMVRCELPHTVAPASKTMAIASCSNPPEEEGKKYNHQLHGRMHQMKNGKSKRVTVSRLASHK